MRVHARPNSSDLAFQILSFGSSLGRGRHAQVNKGYKDTSFGSFATFVSARSLWRASMSANQVSLQPVFFLRLPSGSGSRTAMKLERCIRCFQTGCERHLRLKTTQMHAPLWQSLATQCPHQSTTEVNAFNSLSWWENTTQIGTMVSGSVLDFNPARIFRIACA